MVQENLLLFDQCFELERSKISIKIENFDIELKPVTTEKVLQTSNSELLGRIHSQVDAVPKIVRIEREVDAVDKVVKVDTQTLTNPEPVKVDREVSAVVKAVKVEREVNAVEPEVIRVNTETLAKIENEKFDREIGPDEEIVDSEEEENPLLKTGTDSQTYTEGSLSSLSSAEFETNVEGFSTLSEKDPKTILTWNVCGLAQTKAKKNVWDSFIQLIKQYDPDVVVLQDVKLCSSQILGKCPKLSVRRYGGHVIPSYTQEMQDGNLVNELKKTTFKKYYCVHSLSSWRIAGQLVFVKKEFECLKMRYNLNIKTNAKYHHPEGRCIILQFNSYYLISLLSPLQGWINRSVMLRSRWDRELATFLNNSKSDKATIITGCLNCAPEDIDLSDPEKLKSEKAIMLHKQEEIGYPGSRDVDREGFKWILNSGHLKDVFRVKHPYDGTPNTEKNIKFTTLAFLSDKTKCAVRTNLVLMSKNFLKNVKFCEIIGNVNDLSPSGWRHLPQLLKLEKR